MDETALLVLGLRLALPLLILRFPLIGVLLCAGLDVIDYSFMGNLADYQLLDKLLDTYYLSFAALTVLRWQDRAARNIALVAYSWRVLGVLLIFLVDQRWLLLTFPNFFEPFFVFYLLYTYLARNKQLFQTASRIVAVTIVLLIPKLIQEYILHIYQPAPQLAPSWITYIANHFAWTAAPLYVLPPLILMGLYVFRDRTRKTAKSQQPS